MASWTMGQLAQERQMQLQTVKNNSLMDLIASLEDLGRILITVNGRKTVYLVCLT
jgi:hypothetical protein